jgi:hypothetical protein
MLPLRTVRENLILSARDSWRAYLQVVQRCLRPQPSYGWPPSVHPADTLNQYQSSLIFSWSPKYQALGIPLQFVSDREEIRPCCAHTSRYLWDCRGGLLPFLNAFLAYELPDPLNLRVKVTEETGAKMHGNFQMQPHAHQFVV